MSWFIVEGFKVEINQSIHSIVNFHNLETTKMNDFHE